MKRTCVFVSLLSALVLSPSISAEEKVLIQCDSTNQVKKTRYFSDFFVGDRMQRHVYKEAYKKHISGKVSGKLADERVSCMAWNANQLDYAKSENKRQQKSSEPYGWKFKYLNWTYQ